MSDREPSDTAARVIHKIVAKRDPTIQPWDNMLEEGHRLFRVYAREVIAAEPGLVRLDDVVAKLRALAPQGSTGWAFFIEAARAIEREFGVSPEEGTDREG